MIIEGGADVTIPEKTKWQRQPIHLAAKSGHVSLLKSLVEHGANIQAADNMQMTPLHWAAINGHYDAVSYLIEAGAHINVKDDRARSALFRAAENDYFDIVRLLYTEGGDVNSRDIYGWTPLFQCIVCNQLQMIEELISCGANVNHRDNAWETPLHLLAGRLRPQNLLILCRTHTDFYTRNLKVATPAVHRAIRQVGDDLTVTLLLLDAGADVNATNAKGKTPLAIGAEEGNPYLIQWLMDGGAKLSREAWILSKSWPEKLQHRNPELCDWLFQKANGGPATLVEICKLAVRGSLKPSLSGSIQELPLPGKLKEFLHLNL